VGGGVIKPSPGKQGQSGWGGAGTSNHIFAWDEVNSAEFRGRRFPVVLLTL